MPGADGFASTRLRGRVALVDVVAGFFAATDAAGSGCTRPGANGRDAVGVARAAARGGAAGFASASRGAAAFRVRGARGGGAAGSGTSCGGAIGFGEAGRRGKSCGTRYVNVVL